MGINVTHHEQKKKNNGSIRCTCIVSQHRWKALSLKLQANAKTIISYAPNSAIKKGKRVVSIVPKRKLAMNV
jgi:hypothetical protein